MSFTVSENFSNHDVFEKKNDIFQKKKFMVVKNHINWKSDKFSSTMTLRKKNVMVGKNEK